VEFAQNAKSPANLDLAFVVESQGSLQLVGVVTDRDITIHHVAEGRLSDCPVREAMTDRVSTCTADENVERVMSQEPAPQLWPA